MNGKFWNKNMLEYNQDQNKNFNSNQTPEPTVAPLTDTTVSVEQVAVSQPKRKWWLIILISVVGILIIGGGVYAFLFLNKPVEKVVDEVVNPEPIVETQANATDQAAEMSSWFQKALDEKLLIKKSDFQVELIAEGISSGLDKTSVIKAVQNLNVSILQPEDVSKNLDESSQRVYNFDNGYALIWSTITGVTKIADNNQEVPLVRYSQLYLDEFGSLFILGTDNLDYTRYNESKNSSDLHNFLGYQWDTKALIDFDAFQSVEFKFTDLVVGNDVLGYQWGNNKCQEQFGDDWLWADYHYSDGELSKGLYFDANQYENAWVSITSQNWECSERTNIIGFSGVSFPEDSGMVSKFNYQADNKIIVGWWGEKGEKFSQHGQILYKQCTEKLPILCIKSSKKGKDSIYSKHTNLLDSDSDGLKDEDELKYGTDENNPDTDGDGYKDGDEVKNGYNPMGAGKL